MRRLAALRPIGNENTPGTVVGGVSRLAPVFASLLWPEGLVHYVVNNCVRLPPQVVELLIEPAIVDRAAIDREWWRPVTARHVPM
jgi:hypothetical protein